MGERLRAILGGRAPYSDDLVRATLNATAGLLLAVLALAGCGGGGGATAPSTAARPGGDAALGFPATATKNTTRVPGRDATADAAAAALAVFPSTSASTRPPVVALADAGDWRAALAASMLAARPVRAPLLLSDGPRMSAASQAALARLAPAGSGVLGGAQVVRVGATVQPSGLRASTVAGADPATLAAAVDALATRAAGRPSAAVIVVGQDAPAYAMPAAAWAAKSGDAVLFTGRDALPPATVAALRRRRHPAIYVLGPTSAVSTDVQRRLGRLGTVARISGATPQAAAVVFARFSDGRFGWGLDDPGHGVVFANPDQPAAAPAAAPLSASGTYGPLLLVDADGALPDAVTQFLLDIQPGYEDDPVRGVYNHGWLIGDTAALSEDAQARIDALLEISPVNEPSP
jgi:ell wall binding domain 2 (CWB2)